MKEEHALEIIRATRTFRNLPANLVDKLAHSVRYEHYRQEHLLLQAAQPWENLYFVISGFIEARQRTVTGLETSAIPVQKGGWVSWGGIFPVQTNNLIRSEIWVSGNSQLLTIPCAQIRQVAREWPQLYVQVIEEVNYLIYLMHDVVFFNNLLSGIKKVGRTLLYYNAISSCKDSTTIIVTQERLAQTLNISRQTLSLHLQELQQKKFLTVGYGRIKILDIERLRKYTNI
ncbi:Crp/Fnr family transcriptional regulator [Porticoccaceae bacterium]|nr:Crp/Fnr family transcriptional regulator [Porticoccaceae bacterium]